MGERHYSLTASQLDTLAACIAKAIEKEAFADCVVPSIGAKVLEMLDRIRAADVAADAASRVTLHGKSWGGSPARHLTGNYSDLRALQAAGMAARTRDGWWIPTEVFPD